MFGPRHSRPSVRETFTAPDPAPIEIEVGATRPHEALTDDERRLVSAWFRRLDREAPVSSELIAIPRYVLQRIARTFTAAAETEAVVAAITEANDAR